METCLLFDREHLPWFGCMLLVQHFGLALESYSHFTSPIRRYPDLQIHRIIKEIVSWKFDDSRRDHYESILESVAQTSTLQENLAENIEWKINSLMSVKYMSDKIWEQFSWYISNIDAKWVFIELDNTIQWMVNIDSWLYDFNKLCDWLYEIIDTEWEKINVWKKVTLKVVSVDEWSLKIYFEIV